MQQIEITVEVKDSLKQAEDILKSNGFEISKLARVEDEYLSHHSGDIDKDDILGLLSKCVLLRYLKEEEREIRQITYKNKSYIKGNLATEEKINILCDDLNKARALFSHLDFNKLVDVKYDVIQFKKEDVCIALQNVEGLGLLLEYEGNVDASDCTVSQILEEQQRLVDKVKAFGLSLGSDFNIRKAHELIKTNCISK